MKINEDQSSRTILIADDNKVIVKLMKEFLTRAGYQVTDVNNGEQALKDIPLIQPDLVLLDVDMPGISGFDTCRAIKQNPLTEDIPVLFVTACNERKDIIAGFAAGGQDYILKPFIKEELLARVQTHLALRQAQQELKASVIRYRELSVLDDLTGLFNTRYLYQTLQEQLDSHCTQSLSVVFIDIDNFKHVVDTHGHLNASNTIAELAEIIIPLLPEGCYGVSYGGDEFVVVLANHDSQQGFQVADQLRLAIEQNSFLTFCDLAIHITVSCGVATYPDDALTLTELLDNADLALFESKRRGRNAVIRFAEISRANPPC
ncbi:MAG: diguanylate cyclase [Desulfocapsaceae bacterium]|nr:diguanylate cyclase [Desulfocapsaceae bacterium]